MGQLWPNFAIAYRIFKFLIFNDISLILVPLIKKIVFLNSLKNYCMKKIFVYLLGVISGIVITIIAASILSGRTKDSSLDINLFDEPGDVISITNITGESINVNCFKVMQVLADGAALAIPNELFFSDLIVLLLDYEGKSYYDNQIVTAPKGNCFKQIGTFKYKAKNGNQITVPVVSLMEDNSIKNEGFSFYNEGFSFYKEPGEVMKGNSYKVTRVLEYGVAIAKGEHEKIPSFYVGIDVVIWDDEADFYDGQIVIAPKGQKFRKVGTYKSGTNTYPIVSYRDSGFPENN